jgi:hypothetical protein
MPVGAQISDVFDLLGAKRLEQGGKAQHRADQVSQELRSRTPRRSSS